MKMVADPPDRLKGYLKKRLNIKRVVNDLLGIQSTSGAQGRDLPQLVSH